MTRFWNCSDSIRKKRLKPKRLQKSRQKKAPEKGEYLQGNNAISLCDMAPLREEKREMQSICY